MKLSVVIISHNSILNLRELLPSLTVSLTNIDHEIIIVDNGSTDDTVGMIHNYPEIKKIILPRNFGVAYARNRAIALAKGEYVWILDDDTIVGVEAAKALVDYLDAHPQCGVCSCALVDPDGNRQQSYKSYPGLKIKINNVLGRSAKDPYAKFIEAKQPFEPTYVIGACQMIRHKAFDEIGMLDEHIFYGPEDADFCLRARKAGWGIVYIPTVSIIHKWRRATTRRPFSKIGYKHLQGLIYFYWKHKRLF